MSEHPTRPSAEQLIGLTVIAHTGDGPLRGRIEAVDTDGVRLQVAEAWWESVTWDCLYSDAYIESLPDKDEEAECVTADCAGWAVAECRWYEDGLQIGHYCESCLGVMERHQEDLSVRRYRADKDEERTRLVTALRAIAKWPHHHGAATEARHALAAVGEWNEPHLPLDVQSPDKDEEAIGPPSSVPEGRLRATPAEDAEGGPPGADTAQGRDSARVARAKARVATGLIEGAPLSSREAERGEPRVYEMWLDAEDGGSRSIRVVPESDLAQARTERDEARAQIKHREQLLGELADRETKLKIALAETRAAGDALAEAVGNVTVETGYDRKNLWEARDRWNRTRNTEGGE